MAGMKRSMEGEGNDGTKRYRSQDAVRFLISGRAAGSVIGRAGSNISKLRSETSASITIPDTLGPERVLNISADRETTLKIIEKVIPNLDESREENATEGEIRLLVHTSQAGSIIGKAGCKIKELREESNSQIKVYSEACPQSTDRVVQISGKVENILLCLERILNLLDESPPKGMANPYDPSNYDEMFAPEYGGFADGRQRQGPGPAGMGARGPMRGGMGGMRGGMSAAMRSGMGGMGGMRGGMGGLGGARGGFGGMRGGRAMGGGQLPPGGMDFSAPAGGDMLGMMQGNGGGAGETQQFSVPKGAVGAIIGKGGARIRKIRQDSGATITIDDAKDGQTERVVTINGTGEQIQMAHFLLQKAVRENSDMY